jgi:hypothetical protein
MAGVTYPAGKVRGGKRGEMFEFLSGAEAAYKPSALRKV